MTELASVCVYCGSSEGEDPRYGEAAVALGRILAAEGVTLVYGGGSVGLMGKLAEACLVAGGQVVGVIPGFLRRREVMLREVSELIVTTDMHERKRIMFERSDAFVALPGGIGTLEEVVEMMTWAQLGQHQKPILLANLAGFWNPLNDLLEHMREQAFLRHGRGVSYLTADDVDDIVPMLRGARAELEQVRRPSEDRLSRM